MDTINRSLSFLPPPLSHTVAALAQRIRNGDIITEEEVGELRSVHNALFMDTRRITKAYALYAAPELEAQIETLQIVLDHVFTEDRITNPDLVPAWVHLFDVLVITAGDENRVAYNTVLTSIVNDRQREARMIAAGNSESAWPIPLSAIEIPKLAYAIGGGPSAIARPADMTDVMINFVSVVTEQANRTGDTTLIKIAKELATSV